MPPLGVLGPVTPASLKRSSFELWAAVCEPAVAVRCAMSCKLVLTVCRWSVCKSRETRVSYEAVDTIAHWVRNALTRHACQC